MCNHNSHKERVTIGDIVVGFIVLSLWSSMIAYYFMLATSH